jgi:hypothetical protein
MHDFFPTCHWANYYIASVWRTAAMFSVIQVCLVCQMYALLSWYQTHHSFSHYLLYYSVNIGKNMMAWSLACFVILVGIGYLLNCTITNQVTILISACQAKYSWHGWHTTVRLPDNIRVVIADYVSSFLEFSWLLQSAVTLASLDHVSFSVLYDQSCQGTLVIEEWLLAEDLYNSAIVSSNY